MTDNWINTKKEHGAMYCCKIKQWCAYTNTQTGDCGYEDPPPVRLPDMIDCPDKRVYTSSEACQNCQYQATEADIRRGVPCKYERITGDKVNLSVPIQPDQLIQQDALHIANQIKGINILLRMQQNADMTDKALLTQQKIANLAETLAASGRFSRMLEIINQKEMI